MKKLSGSICVYVITVEQVVKTSKTVGPGAPSVSALLHRLNQVNLSRREQETGTELARRTQDRTRQDIRRNKRRQILWL